MHAVHGRAHNFQEDNLKKKKPAAIEGPPGPIDGALQDQ